MSTTFENATMIERRQMIEDALVKAFDGELNIGNDECGERCFVISQEWPKEDRTLRLYDVAKLVEVELS